MEEDCLGRDSFLDCLSPVFHKDGGDRTVPVTRIVHVERFLHEELQLDGVGSAQPQRVVDSITDGKKTPSVVRLLLKCFDVFQKKVGLLSLALLLFGCVELE